MHACKEQERTAIAHASGPNSYVTLPNVIHVHALSLRPKGAYFPCVFELLNEVTLRAHNQGPPRHQTALHVITMVSLVK
jgi:hypothetical protein